MKKQEANGNREKRATRQCWECLKRRLVCDHTLPHCKKCQKAGKECPGYDEQKPLQWVEPGKVTSRRRKKDAGSKKQSQATTTYMSQPKTTPSRNIVVPLPAERIEDGDFRLMETEVTVELTERGAKVVGLPEDEKLWGPKTQEWWDKIVKKAEFLEANNLTDIEKFFRLGDKKTIQRIVAKGLREEAERILTKERDPLGRLEKMLQWMETEDIPCYNLSNDTTDVVQAVGYYNQRIYPELEALKVLAPNPNIMVFPMAALHLLPPPVHHIIVCLSINHFVHSLPAGTSREMVSGNWSKMYQHRGQAIRFLSEKIGKNKTRCSDGTLTSVFMFLCTELQQSSSVNWRTHADGLVRLLNMRGGFMTVVREAPHLGPALMIFLLIVVMSNTTTPAGEQMQLSLSLEPFLTEVSDLFNLLFPQVLCPPPLFFEIIRINHLRNQASMSLLGFDDDSDLYLDANEILDRIEAFAPEDWAQPGARNADWRVLGTMWQSAVAIYCTMSLQSMTILPSNLEMNAMRSIHGDRLLGAIQSAVASPMLKKFVFWPLVVLGVEAASRDSSTKRWVEEALDDLSRELGTSSPLKARAKLRRYWQTEEHGWDECFDRPYCFVV